MASTPRAWLAEAIGTFVFVTLGAGVVVVAFGFQGGYGILEIALAHGLAIAIMVSVFGGISGGHFNPAVTLGVLAGGKIEPGRALAYISAQLVGASAGAGLLRQIFNQQVWERSNIGTPAITGDLTIGKAVLIEAVLTFFLVLAVWGTGVDPRGSNVGGFAIGLTVTVGIMLGFVMTGAAMNPARHFGPAVVSGALDNWWVYYVGPALGGILAGMVYRSFFWEETGVMPAVAAGATVPPETEEAMMEAAFADDEPSVAVPGTPVVAESAPPPPVAAPPPADPTAGAGTPPAQPSETISEPPFSEAADDASREQEERRGGES